MPAARCPSIRLLSVNLFHGCRAARRQRCAIRRLAVEPPVAPEETAVGAAQRAHRHGSGKSNLIAAIELLRAAPRDLVAPIREGGGIGEWLHKSTSRAWKGTVETTVDFPLPSGPLRYRLTVEEQLHRLHVHDEFIEDDVPETGLGRPYRYFGYLRGAAEGKDRPEVRTTELASSQRPSQLRRSRTSVSNSTRSGSTANGPSAGRQRRASRSHPFPR